MNSSPKVSVLLPCFNGAKFLDETIQSILNQTYKDFELIIIDDCSTDESIQVIKPYLNDARITLYVNENNLGVVKNWNKCMDLANGTYIKFICSDDKFHPQILEKFVPVLDEHLNVSLVGCNKEEFGGQNILWKVPFDYQQPGKQVVLETAQNFNYLGEPTCVMFRKADVFKVGPFRNYRWIIDWEMWVRLLSIGDCYMVPERLCFTRNHPGQVTKSVWKNYIHYFEEYTLFKELKKGSYFFNFNKEESQIIDKVLEWKRWRIYNSIPEVLRRVYLRGNKEVLRKIFRLAADEHYLGTVFQVFAGRVLGKFVGFGVQRS